MSWTAIEVKGLGKEYQIGERIKYSTIRESISRLTADNYKRLLSAILRRSVKEQDTIPASWSDKNESRSNQFWCLKDISFNVGGGEIIGIIGRNGAGKSTLLKIISGITEPTEGRINIYGRIGSLLEVGTGFHYELTGRENIYLNGAILGMKKREINRKFDEIVDFSEVERFIDTPVKYYSTGMRVRLGFSVAAHLEPEILLVDEVLAVGDAAFQKKCLGKLDNISTSEGRTILFVSHDMASILSLCERAILLDSGKIALDGPTENVVEHYLKSMSLLEYIPLEEREDVDKHCDNSIVPTSLTIENVEFGKPIRPTSRIKMQIKYRSKSLVRNLVVHIMIRDYKTGQAITHLDSDNSGGIPETIPAEGTIICSTNKTYLTSGRCTVDITFIKGMLKVYHLDNAGFFNVEEEIVYGSANKSRNRGMYLLEHKWSFEE